MLSQATQEVMWRIYQGILVGYQEAHHPLKVLQLAQLMTEVIAEAQV